MSKPQYGSLITQAAALLKFRTFEAGDRLDSELCEAAISLRHCADRLRELEAQLAAAAVVCEAYFSVATDYYSEDEVRRRRDAYLEAEAAKRRAAALAQELNR